MQIRHAEKNDLPVMCAIYSRAREFMAKNGNPNQWGPTNWPPEALLERDIAEGNSYVCLEGGRVIGTFFYAFGRDIEPTYAVIGEGGWHDDTPYGVVHRLAGDGSVPGIGTACLEWAYARCGHLRVDTHGDNKVMQGLLKKLGFTYCGIIHVVEDVYPRLAYEKSERK